ncbi:MAG: vitamin B12 dependent methionine synthase [Firmicutes bacterium]|nr:vitamin B12 dependent methionine synthase [Bacillota bacterium]
MEPVVIDDLKVDIHRGGLLRTLRAEDTDDGRQILALLDSALGVSSPKAIYKEAFIDARGDDYVVVEGIEFKSRILRINLDGAHRVFPYVVTAGRELDVWSFAVTGMLEQYWADKIKEAVLHSAFRDFTSRLIATYSLGTTAVMNPGSLDDWPISEQKKLFQLLGDPTAAIGVELTDSYLMIPTKSVSGIRFATQTTYENCQLCPRENCPGRRAPYDPLLYENRYKAISS